MQDSGLLQWCPAAVAEALDLAHALVSRVGCVSLKALALAASPGFWLPLVEADCVCGVALSGGWPAAWGTALASALGFPVPALAARAFLVESGLRRAAGAFGFIYPLACRLPLQRDRKLPLPQSAGGF